MKKNFLIFSFIWLVVYSPLQSFKFIESWKAPTWTDTLINPYPVEPLTLPQGEEIYGLYCGICHKEKSLNNGMSPNEKSDRFYQGIQKQTAGAIYWKITTGRGDMPAFEDALSEEQRWQLVEYLKQLTIKYRKKDN